MPLFDAFALQSADDEWLLWPPLALAARSAAVYTEIVVAEWKLVSSKSRWSSLSAGHSSTIDWMLLSVWNFREFILFFFVSFLIEKGKYVKHKPPKPDRWPRIVSSFRLLLLASYQGTLAVIDYWSNHSIRVPYSATAPLDSESEIMNWWKFLYLTLIYKHRFEHTSWHAAIMCETRSDSGISRFSCHPFSAFKMSSCWMDFVVCWLHSVLKLHMSTLSLCWRYEILGWNIEQMDRF